MHFNSTINKAKVFKVNSIDSYESRNAEDVEEIFDNLKKFFKNGVKIIRSKKLELMADNNDIMKIRKYKSARPTSVEGLNNESQRLSR